jgi:hypothetical protein
MKKDFKVKDKVKMFDEEDNAYVYGTVFDIQPDKIIIEWDDLCTPCTHYRDEWLKIIILK